MKIIQPRVELIVDDYDLQMRKIEWAGRKCYKSEEAITEDSHSDFIRKLIKMGHESVIEHGYMTANFIVDRGVSHELVRHRLSNFSQESTRYCTYSADKFGNEITVIEPYWWEKDSPEYYNWFTSCSHAEHSYLDMTNLGIAAQYARSVLPNSLKTEVVMTCNFREWRHVFKLRAQKAAHPQMQQVMIPLLLVCKTMLPEIFEDIGYNESFPYEHCASIIIKSLESPTFSS